MKTIARLRRSESRPVLFIFVSSPRPEPYINVLAYTIQHIRPSSIALVKISESSNQMIDEERITSIQARIVTALEELAAGYYTRSDHKSPIGAGGSSLYKACLKGLDDAEVRSITIPYDALDDKLSEFIADGSTMIDVTTLKKNLLVDVVALLLSRGYSEIYSFEFSQPPQYFDDRELLHALGNESYVYRKISESSHIQTATRRIVSSSITLRSVLILTAILASIVTFVTLFYPHSWPNTVVGVLATSTGIAGWAFQVRRNG